MKIPSYLLLIFFVCISCSTTKTIPSQYISQEFRELQLDRMLVFANTEDTALQNRFEDKMAVVLRENGITPFKMHEVFPDIEYKESHSQEEIKDFILQCKKKDIDKVLFASQKSMTVDTVLTKSLHNYMNSLEPLRLHSDTEENLEYDKTQITTYTIEAAVYDIAVSSEDKPIATATLKATNPKSFDKLENKFLNAIKKLFKSR
ncbi:hypothetical protein G5B37_05920 [Rasiella rasia]|uniref:Lipoprotein n=1 Tax=Rasiella rasia TaxID=2744027 RepID=A0A6G6GKU6_9FLAO|nr:hypothetical protein [Rasiella rasia]QIE59110.1 hypothetical protein G5B37_05920 [Rasiella rasia]